MTSKDKKALTNIGWFLPAGTPASALALFSSRALRGVSDGCISIILPAYLLALGFNTLEIGLLSTATLLGSALLTMAIGLWGHRLSQQRLLLLASISMAVTGFSFASFSLYGALLWVAFLGTLNTSGGDVSVFLPLEHSQLSQASATNSRTAIFARYGLLGSLGGALGSLMAGLPQLISHTFAVSDLAGFRLMFVSYGFVGLCVGFIYLRHPQPEPADHKAPSPLKQSKRTVTQLALLFSMDSFASGLVIQSLLALWLLERFDVSLLSAGVYFFWAGLMSALSQLLAPSLARRIGLLNCMVLTHIPASLFLLMAAFAPTLETAIACLLSRALLSQMDVPARSAFVMIVVTPAERVAAASFTNVPKSLASAVSPTIAGALFASGFVSSPLIICALLKITYDIVLWFAFRHAEADGFK